MKYNGLFMVAGAAALAFASPALAFHISNLDHVPYTVVYESAGTATEYTIVPGSTEYVAGQSDGLLSLQQPRTGKVQRAGGSVRANGILSGIVGTASTADMPARGEDDFAIWPGGDLRVQHRRDISGGARF